MSAEPLLSVVKMLLWAAKTCFETAFYSWGKWTGVLEFCKQGKLASEEFLRDFTYSSRSACAKCSIVWTRAFTCFGHCAAYTCSLIIVLLQQRYRYFSIVFPWALGYKLAECCCLVCLISSLAWSLLPSSLKVPAFLRPTVQHSGSVNIVSLDIILCFCLWR